MRDDGAPDPAGSKEAATPRAPLSSEQNAPSLAKSSVPAAASPGMFGGHGKILAVIALVIVALTIPFGFAIHHNHSVFSEYRRATLEDPSKPPPWEAGELTIEECVTSAIDWALECPGVQSWCEAEVPVVMSMCLKSASREAECAEIGDAHMTTRFGYDECLERREDVEGTYRARAHKKYCALAYRAVAGQCRRISES